MTTPPIGGETAHDGTEVPVREIGGADAAPMATQWVAAYSGAVRFAAGVAGVVADRAREIAETRAGTDPDDVDVDEQPPVPGTVLFGFAADLPARFDRMTTAVNESTGMVRSAAGASWRLVAASPIGGLAEAVLERVDAESDRLFAVGRAEVAYGKTLVETVVDATIEGVLDNVSDSEALNDLIREKAAGVTDLAIQEVRETGAAADDLTDRAIRRLMRRPERDLPPKPAASA